MSNIQAFSSVVVTDLSDAGQISAYLGSSQPITVTYNPNQNTYTPNWGTSNLVITPFISYNGSPLSLDAVGLQVWFKRQEGSGSPTVLSSGETVSGNKLTVSANKLASVTSGQLTYICEVVYTNPDTSIPLRQQQSFTYSLVTLATELKSANITGESVFLYDANRALIGSNKIVLSANLENTSVNQWQYKKADGTFAAFPTTNNTSITGATLNVLATEADIWINSRQATIKLTTSDTSIFDLHTITKIYDGVAGNDTVSAVLSNENHLVPVSSSGAVKSWVGSETSITIYEGGKDVTASWNISVANGAGLTGSYNATTKTFTPSGLSVDASYAEFTCTKTGNANIIKRYTITKQYAGGDGADAVIYSVEPSVRVLNLSESGVFSPANVSFSGYKKIGSSLVKTNYSGRFVISESVDGKTFATKYTSASDELTKVYTPSTNSVRVIKCTLYSAGGTSTQLDEETVLIVKDGVTGEDGTNGSNGVSLVVGNDSEVIACNTSGNVFATKDISIPFYGYDGIKRAAVSCTVGTLPSGMTVKSNTAGTVSAGGLLVLNVASSATLGSSALMSGDITLTFLCMGQSIEKKFTWTKSKQASNGVNAVLFQLFSPDGGVIYNGEGQTTINTMMTSGTGAVTPTSFTWAKYSGGSYATLTGKTSSSLVVTADMVDSTAWFRCQAVYRGNTYTSYWTVTDISDPVQSYTFTTKAQFSNGIGEGAVYTRVYRNGIELDPIKSTVFSTTAPASPKAGDFYYHLEKTTKTCTLKKYSGTAWANATETDTLNYEYRRINSKGISLDEAAPYKNTRCFYVDGTNVDGQMQFMCKVTD